MAQNNFLKNSGWWLLPILSVIPVLIWALGSPINIRSFGDIFGIAGMAMFSLVMILSARLKFFEKIFNGMNENYSAHHNFGAIAFCLLLFHPLFLAYNYLAISFHSAAIFLLPGQNFAQNLGIYGLFVMIIALFITFYTKLKYYIWKYTHKFMGVAFIFAFFHVILIGADISANHWLKIYLFVLGILAIGAYFYSAVLGAVLIKNYKYKIKNVVEMPDKTVEIELLPIGREMKFLPGQFAFVKFYNKALSREAHPFSMSSSPGFPLKFGIKELGDYTNKIKELKAGDLARIEGPFGTFNFRNFGKEQIWIAGGIGITPFMSMLRSLTPADSDYKIDLYFSVKDEESLIYKEEIEKFALANKNLNAIFWRTNTNGFISAISVGEKTSNIKNRDILICGPGAMMSALKKQLLERGIERSKIHAENFEF